MNRYPQTAWPAAVIVLVGLLCYLNSLGGAFVFDDASSIVTNPTIRHLGAIGEVLATPATQVTAQGRPLLNLSLALNYALGGTAVVGYHWVNLAIHLAAALALFGLVHRTLGLPGLPARFSTRATAIALAIAVLWVAHPLQTQAVSYVIQRAESLMGLFYLLTLYGFVRGAAPAGRRAWLMVAFVACLCGMATKEVMATAPLMVLLFDRTFLAGGFAAALARRRWFYAGLAATWVLLGFLVLGGGGNRGGSIGFGTGTAWWAYSATQFGAVCHYLRLALLPYPLVFEYGTIWVKSVPEVLGPALLVAALLAATAYAVIRLPRLGFVAAWFFMILAVTSVIPGTTQMIVEYRMYLPLAAVMTGIVLMGVSLFGDHLWLPLVVVVLALGATTVARNRDYRTAVALWQDTVDKRPRNALAHEMLAEAREGEGEYADARAEHERALALYPDFLPAHEGLADDLVRLKQPAAAFDHYRAAAALKPDFADPHDGLGEILREAGHPERAVPEFDEAIRLKPDYAEAYFNRGNAWSSLGKTERAAVDFEAALRVRPDFSEAGFNLANSLVALGRTAAAEAQFQAVLAQRPEYAKAHYNYGNLLLGLNRLGAAETQYRAALAADPEFLDARYNLAGVLRVQGHLPAAAQEYRTILASRPDAAEARQRLREIDGTP